MLITISAKTLIGGPPVWCGTSLAVAQPTETSITSAQSVLSAISGRKRRGWSDSFFPSRIAATTIPAASRIVTPAYPTRLRSKRRSTRPVTRSTPLRRSMNRIPRW
jgi:hypothetical protein